MLKFYVRIRKQTGSVKEMVLEELLKIKLWLGSYFQDMYIWILFYKVITLEFD